jgi:beta-lactamase regulating signal transducer with metallopeptidase domain
MNTPLPQMLVQNLGWTLIHFLWQGTVLAALLWLLPRVPGSSSRRYLTACFALLLMALAPTITFAWLARQHQSTGASATAEPVPSLITNVETAVTGPPVKITVPFRANSRPPTLSERLEGFLPWLVCGWLAGVLCFSARLGAGWLQVRKLGRVAAQPLGEPWKTRVAELARRLGINRSLRLLQSALVEVPAVIGWLRPVILIPAGCLSGLTPQQLESILAHELAHVRRHDYLVNALQSVVETLLFYHPAVWWVSRRIREERENCCDDLAVKICGDRVAYARALATLEESRLAPAQCALAAAGPPLLQRIRRLLGKPEDVGRSGWLFGGMIMAMSILALSLVFHGNRALAAGKRASAQTSGVSAKIMESSLPADGSSDTADSAVSNQNANAVVNAPAVETPSSITRTNLIFNSDAHQAIASKLTRIHLDSVKFDRLPLSQVLNNLSDESRKLDSEGKGIKFIVAHDSADAGSAVITVIPSLTGIRLLDVLDVIIKVADKPLKYSIGADGVTFSLKYPEHEPLYTRIYHVDPNTFRRGLEAQGIFLTNSAVGHRTNLHPQIGPDNGRSDPATIPASDPVSEQVRQFFTSLGLDFSTNSGRKLVYNSRVGEMLVRASATDLNLLEHTLTIFNIQSTPPPLVELQVKFVEIERSNSATNRLDWLPAGAAATFTTNTARKFSEPPLFATPSGESSVLDPAKLPRSPTNSIVTQFEGLLTGPQGQAVIQALQQGVDVLTAPNVITESGRQAQIAVTQAHTIVTGLDSGRDANGAVTNNYRTQNIECGAVLDAIPRVLEDGSIEVSVAGTVTEFLGYDDPQSPAFKKEAASGPANARFPLPRFRVRQVATKTAAQDGQVIVLGGFVGDSVATRTVSKVPALGDLPLLGRLFKTTTVHQSKKELIIFITPTIVQPDGSRVHSEPAVPPPK